ncbi:MAG: S46 family peptidase, partial [Bacteroidales bacterium]|nr:S46 family peptidase [Bacteroidales bacterium]
MKKILIITIIITFFQPESKADEGMWIPMFLNDLNETEMQAMGMNITAEDIYSINRSSLKDAIMIFGGGCTAELISGQGLILTNHHCGFRRIQQHSSIENDYLTDGFWAMDQSEELSNPGLKVTFLVRMEEVTDAVLEGVNKNMNEADRDALIKTNSDTIKERAVEDTHYKAIVKPFFQGNRYFLFINEVFEDVRLVGAPPSNIGKFGGDTDNWVWPRHTGDFSLFRIYADTNNQPAAYSEDNVPYKPKSHLNISLKGVKENDFTFVFGYPGTTHEYLPSYGIELQVNTINPIRIGIRDKRIAIFNEFMNKSPETRLQYAAKHAGISNGWKKWIGENRGIKRLKTIEQKKQFEAEFTKWVNTSEELKEKYSTLLPEFNSTYEKIASFQYNATYLRETFYGIEIIKYAFGYKKLVELSKDKKSKTEMDSLLEKQKAGAAAFLKNYQAVVDKRVFTDVLRDYYSNVDKTEIPEQLTGMYTKFKGDFNAMADWVFEKSIFVSEERIMNMLDNYKRGHRKKIEKDPAYQLAIGFYSRYFNTYLPVLKTESNKIDSLMRHYMQAQMEMQPMKKFYPDANFTLRVGYGNVKGFSPDDAKNYRYFTTLDGIMEKEDPEIYDYVVEDKLKELYNSQDYGRYGDEDGSMHVCFIATNHTTGGNSGSPVLDANGNLIGLNFDGCWESTMSDLFYDMEQCRNIALDIRYCL